MNACAELGLRQVVREPTRGNHLLDLVLTDLDDLVSVTVLESIADHRSVLCELHVGSRPEKKIERIVWQFNKADWNDLNNRLATTDWDHLASGTLDSAVANVTAHILAEAEACIPKRVCVEQKGQHRWIKR